jgi:hypothetical protein
LLAALDLAEAEVESESEEQEDGEDNGEQSSQQDQSGEYCNQTEGALVGQSGLQEGRDCEGSNILGRPLGIFTENPQERVEGSAPRAGRRTAPLKCVLAAGTARAWPRSGG